jgi:preprotein translocase subunit YajC
MSGFGVLAQFLNFCLAQDTPAGEGAGGQDPMSGILSMLPLFIGLYVVFYFLLIRPQRKQQREHRDLLDGLKKNDSVRTNGGIFGKVVSIDVDKDQVVLKVDENQNVRLRVLRSSIAVVLDREENQSPAATAGKSR